MTKKGTLAKINGEVNFETVEPEVFNAKDSINFLHNLNSVRSLAQGQVENPMLKRGKTYKTNDSKKPFGNLMAFSINVK